MTEAAKIITIEQPPSALAPITPMQMLQLAVEKGADVAQLERLMALQERWEATQARKAYVEAKAAFYREAPEITKNKHVGFTSKRTGDDTNYWHATLDHVVETASPVLAKHGLTHSWSTSQDDKGIEVTCILRHVMGHEERVSLKALPEMSGTKNPIQGIGSTITFLERYTFMAVTGLAAKNQDEDGRTGEDFVTEEQCNELMALADDVGADKQKFCAWFKVASFAEIPATQYKRAKDALEAKRKGKPA